MADYLRFEKISQSQVVYDENIPFPQIVICSDPNRTYEIQQYKFNQKDCTEDHDYISVVVDDVIYPCVRFNGGKNRSGHSIEIKKAHGINNMRSGFSMVLSVNRTFPYNYLSISENSKYPEFWSSFFALEFSTENYITLKRKVDEKLGEPYNSCWEEDALRESDSDLIQEIIKLNDFYNRNMCYQLCSFKYISRKHNCSIKSIYDLENSENKQPCRKNLNPSDFESKKCHDECPFPCRTSSFSYQVEKLKSENLSNHSFLLEIDYDDYKYSLTSQIPKTKITDLAAKLGGILGLFVGLKFLSFIEIVEFFLGFLMGVKEKFSRKSNQISS